MPFSLTSTTAGASAALTCAQGGVCAIGDTGPGGGIVFYVQAPTVSAPWKYMEVAPNTWSAGTVSPTIAWSSNTSVFVPNLLTGNTSTVQTSTAIGSGYANTQKMLRGGTFGAAQAVTSYNGGGKSNWHLPSKDELAQLYSKSEIVEGFLDEGHWSSSEYTAGNAWGQMFNNGAQGNYGKTNPYCVRPVRAF
jgi:Protein of unknown function (DUF1566)